MMLLSKIKKEIQFAVEMSHGQARECDKEKAAHAHPHEEKRWKKRDSKLSRKKQKEHENCWTVHKKCSLFMHKLRSKCRNEAKKISTKLFFGGYHFFPSSSSSSSLECAYKKQYSTGTFLFFCSPPNQLCIEQERLIISYILFTFALMVVSLN